MSQWLNTVFKILPFIAIINLISNVDSLYNKASTSQTKQTTHQYAIATPS